MIDGGTVIPSRPRGLPFPRPQHRRRMIIPTRLFMSSDTTTNNRTYDNTVRPRLHDTTGCPTGNQTGLTTGWTTDCIVYANIQLVVQPVVQLV